MINIICLKHGTKYGFDYVNKLYNMVSRHLSLPFHFVCFTDDANHIDARIETRPLPSNKYAGWWWKPYVFEKNHFKEGDTNLFLDLDTVIIDNIDHYFSYEVGSFMGLRDVSRAINPSSFKLGSAVLRWEAGLYSDIWDTLVKNPNLMKIMHGDQDLIWNLHKDTIKFYPDDWIRSYKWEIRDKSELIGVGPGTRFRDNRNPMVNPNTSIIAFHGYPKPCQVHDKIILDNWL